VDDDGAVDRPHALVIAGEVLGVAAAGADQHVRGELARR
jgi:hypothetical protein